MDRIRVGLVGCGHIGRFHSRNIRAVVRSELLPVDYVGVADRDLSRAQDFVALTGVEHVAESAEELFERASLDAVYICTETAEHPALVSLAASRGLAVFCEKPLGVNSRSVIAMVDAVNEAGVTNQVGLILRTSPVYTVLKSMIESEDLGALLHAHLRDDQCFPIKGHYQSSWRGDVARAGGGTLLEHSIHDVDLFRWLFGEIHGVRCQTRNVAGHPGIEDVALVTFDHEGGHQTTLASVWHDVDARPSSRSLEVFYQRGWFATNSDFLGSLTYQLADGPETTISDKEVFDRYVAVEGLSDEEAELARAGVLADYRFLRAASLKEPAFPDFDTASRAHAVVDSAYQSAADKGNLQIVR